MATCPRDNIQNAKENLFNKLRKKIEESFDCIIQKANERRTALLEQLAQMERNDPEEMKSSKQEMEVLLVTMKSDEAKKSLQKSIDELTKKISDCEKNGFEPSFACETNELEWEISQLGVLSTLKKIENTAIIVRQYDSIQKPLVAFGTPGKILNQFSKPRGVLVDEANRRVLICDRNNRVQVWSLNGEYLSDFGAGTLKWPWEIVHHGTSLFVSDFETHRLSKWSSDSLKFLAKSKITQGTKLGRLYKPAGLDIDFGEVFVVEYGSKCISVFDLNLRFKRIMADQVIDAFCLRIRSDVIYVVEVTGVIKLLSKSDQLLKRIDKSDIFSDFVYHFNFDSALNFLITDSYNNSLSILSPVGKLMQCIRFDNWDVKEPYGIDLTRNGNVVICFQEGFAAVITC